MTTEELAQIQDDLAHFTGTHRYYKFNEIYPDVLLSDGAQYVAGRLDAYWLMNEIAMAVPVVMDRMIQERLSFFSVVSLTRFGGPEKKHTLLNIADDVPENVILFQKAIPDSVLPFHDLKLYLSLSGENWIIYLPQEH